MEFRLIVLIRGFVDSAKIVVSKDEYEYVVLPFMIDPDDFISEIAIRKAIVGSNVIGFYYDQLAINANVPAEFRLINLLKSNSEGFREFVKRRFDYTELDSADPREFFGMINEMLIAYNI